MTPGKVSAITPPRTSDQSAKRVKKPSTARDSDSAVSTDGTAPHTNQESFIIPGTATGPDRPLVNPEKTAAAKTLSNIPITGPVSTAGAGSPVREQHQ
jgi:hypothetical protein